MKILWLSSFPFDRSSRESLSAARKIASKFSLTLSCGVWGYNFNEKDDIFGNEEIIIVDNSELDFPRFCTDIFAADFIVKKISPDIIIMPANSRCQRIVGALSHRNNGKVDTHVVSFENVNGELVIKRWYFKSRILVTETTDVRPWFISIEQGCFEWENPNEKAPNMIKMSIDIPSEFIQTKTIGYKFPDKEHATIKPDAELLFVAGAGWTKKQPDGELHLEKASELIWNFLEKSGASLGGSKSIVDLSSEGEKAIPFMTHLNQVGQTGSTPVHRKGLATCCHGEEPHVIGWRFIKERRAINLDPNCGWSKGKADIVYVADAFKVVEKINELLEK